MNTARKDLKNNKIKKTMERMIRKDEFKNIDQLPQRWLSIYFWAGVKMSVFISVSVISYIKIMWGYEKTLFLSENMPVIIIHFVVSIASLSFVLFMWRKTMNEYNGWYLELGDPGKWFVKKYKEYIDGLLFFWGIIMLIQLPHLALIDDLSNLSNFYVFLLCVGLSFFFIDTLKRGLKSISLKDKV